MTITRLKLVRDKCDAVREEGDSARPANSEEGKLLALFAKLHEEAAELCKTPDDPSEFADVMEVMIAIAQITKVDWEEVQRIGTAKRRRKGGFRRGLIWIRRSKQEPLTS